MYPSQYSLSKHNDLLEQSRRDRQAAQLRALRKAARRLDRAERRLARAKATARRLRGELRQVY